jgi:hypothetical protein
MLVALQPKRFLRLVAAADASVGGPRTALVAAR